jgi:MFS family permease
VQDIGAVFRNRDLRRLELAAAGSIIGNWAYVIALFVYAYDQGGAAAVAVVSLIRMIPAALGAPFTSSLADRFDRKLVMIGADVTRALLMGVIAVTIWLDGPVAIVYALVAVTTITSTAFLPAEAALLPSLAKSPGELTAANVALSTLESTASFIGPALGGVLLVLTNVPIVFGVNGVSFLWSAALLLGIRTRPLDSRADTELGDGGTDRGETAPDDEPSSGRITELTAGLRAIAASRDLRLLVGLYATQTLGAGALEVLIVATSFDLLGAGEGGIGYLNAAVGVGGLLGGFVALVLATRGRLASNFGLGVALYGLPLVLVGAVASMPAALLGMAIVGLGNSLVDINAITIMQRTVPDAILGRALGVLDAVLLGSIGIGAVLAPVLIGAFGIEGALVAVGVTLPLVTLTGSRGLRALDARPAPAHVRLLRGCTILEALPEAAVERLARSLTEIRLPAGSVVIQKGDVGDLFYVIGEGEVEVAGTVLKSGDSFGEIALLRDVPRTATVAATSDVVLYSLEREIFVAAVTGHAPAHATAETVIASRLGGFRAERVQFVD